MSTPWEAVVEALRDELQEYGGLLNLFEDQQAAILQRRPEVVLEVTASIEEQLKTISERRNYREELVRKSSRTVQTTSDGLVREVISYFPEAVRSLANALVDEVNNLLIRTKRRARQNQMLLVRSIEVSQAILRMLDPGVVSTTYSRKGKLRFGVTGGASRVLSRN